MNLKLLNDVLALIEERSFTNAAQRRNVTQPAFSRRIKSMEDWLGFKCVVRSGSSVTVTAEALATEERIRSLISQMNELKSYMASEAPQKRRVVFTAPHTLSIHLFPNLIKLLNESAGDVEYTYRLKSSYKEDCLAVFLRGDADIFICNEEIGKSSIPPSFQCERIILGADKLIPVSNKALADVICADEPSDNFVPIITYPEDSYLWRMVGQDSLPKLMDQHKLETVCETALSAGVKELVLEGVGLGWLPKSFVKKELDQGKLITLEERFGYSSMTLTLYIASASLKSGMEPVFEAFKNMNDISLLKTPD